MKEKIIKYIDDHREEMVALLGKYVNTDSGSLTLEGVDKVAEMSRKELESIGFECVRLKSGKYADHLLAKKRGTGKGRVLFLCHMDTVFKEGTAAERPFRVEGDKAFGPGVNDMQAGIISTIYLLKALDAAGYTDYEEIKVLMNSDEERGSVTSQKYIEEAARTSDIALIMEPGKDGHYVVIDRQGGGIANLDIYGKKSHAGSKPLEGIHAINEAVKKIEAMNAETDYSIGKSLSAGVIRGGERSNIIPDHVFIEIDIRCRKNSDGLYLLKRLQEIADTSYVPGTTSKLEIVMFRSPIEKTEGNIKAYNLLKEVADELGVPLDEKYSGGGSDGSYTAGVGIPTIDSLGPVGDNSHTEEEYMLLPTMFDRTKLVALYVTKITGSK